MLPDKTAERKIEAEEIIHNKASVFEILLKKANILTS